MSFEFMTGPDQANLREQLAELVKYLRLTNKMPTSETTDEIVDRIMHTLEKSPDINLSLNDVNNNPQVQHDLHMICVSEVLKPNSQMLENIISLRDPSVNFEESLKVLLKKSMVDMLKLTPDFQNEKDPNKQNQMKLEIEKVAEQYAEKLSNSRNPEAAIHLTLSMNISGLLLAKLDDKLRLALSDRLKELKADRANESETLNRSLTGVGKTGELFVPVQAQPGNLIGACDYITFGDAFLSKVDAPDIGVVDPNGMNTYAAIICCSEGGGGFNGLLDEMEADGLVPQPESIKPLSTKMTPSFRR